MLNYEDGVGLATRAFSSTQTFNNSFVSITFYSEREEEGGGESSEAGCDAADTAFESNFGGAKGCSLGCIDKAEPELFVLAVACPAVSGPVVVNLPSDACEFVSDIGGGVCAVEGILVVVPVVSSVTHRCEAIGFE